MSHKDYDEADGVFDIDGDDADQDLDLDAEETSARPPKPRGGLARETKVGLSVIAALLVVFIAVLVYRLSRPANDVIAKRSNETDAAAKTSTAKKTEPDANKPTVVTPARQGSAGTNPWATDFSKKSQTGRGYGNLQGTNNIASASDDSANDATVRSDTVAKNPFDARGATDRSRDSKTKTSFDLSNPRPGSAYGNLTDSDGTDSTDENTAATDPPGDHARTQATDTIREGSLTGAEPRDPFGLAKRNAGSIASAATNDDDEPHGIQGNDSDKATPPPLKFGSNDLLSGASAEWDKKQEQRSKSAVPESSSVGANDVAPAKRSDLRSAPPRNTKVAAEDRESATPSLPAERKGESHRFGSDRATQPVETAEDRATEAPRFAGSRKNAFEREAPDGAAKQIDAVDNLDSRTAAPVQSKSAAAAGEQTYATRPGDTYWKVSERFYGSGAYFKALYEHNRRTLRNPDRLQAGADLQVPDEATLRRLYPALCPGSTRKTASAGRATRAVATARNTEPIYVVEDGDTLYEIARSQLGKSSRWGEIFELNRDVLGDKLEALSPGTELVLPADARRASTTRQTGGLNSEAE